MNVQNHGEAAKDDLDETDEALIGSVLAGNDAAYELLVRRHAPRLLTMIRGQVRSLDDAEDLMQEALAQAYFKLSTFAGKSSFFTWLYRIAWNMNISKHRKRRFESTHTNVSMEDAALPHDQTPPVDQAMSTCEQADQVWQAIDCLHGERREVLVLRDMQGLDYDEIATLLSIPKGTVRSRLHRARIELREILIRRGAIEI